MAARPDPPNAGSFGTGPGALVAFLDRFGPYLDLASLSSTRALLRARGGRLLSVLLGVVYAVVSVSIGKMLTLSVPGSPWSVALQGSSAGLAWWEVPALSVTTPSLTLFLPFLPTLTLALSSLGVGLGGAAALLLLLPHLNLRSRGQSPGPLPGTGAAGVATVSCATVAGGASVGVAPTVAVSALGAGCCAGTSASAGVVVVTSGGGALGTLLFGMLVMEVFQISILWVSLLIQEWEIRPRLVADVRHASERPLGRAFAAGLGLRVLLLVAGISGSLAMLIMWATGAPTDAGAALWYHWLFEEQLLSALALVTAFFPREVYAVVDQALKSRIGRAQLLGIRGAAAVAGITWGVLVPPALLALGLGGFGNELLGFFAVSSPWAKAPSDPWGAALLFHWTLEQLVPSSFALLFAARPRWALSPLLGGAVAAPPVQSRSAVSVADEDLGPPSKGARAARFGLNRVPRASVALTVAALLVAVGIGAVLYEVSLGTPAPYVGVLRTYYVAANEIEWNFTPAGMNEITGEPFGVGNATELQYTAHNATYLGTTLLMCVYQQYTDGTFLHPVVRPPSQAYLGILGPVLYAVVGDTLQVVFQNNCRFAESLQPRGLAPVGGPGAYVLPGGTFTYTWYIPPSAGPGPNQPSTTLWEYTSAPWPVISQGPPSTPPISIHPTPLAGAGTLNVTDTGLVGPILISTPAAANPNGTPKMTNIIDAFAIFSESNSPYLGQDILDHAEDPAEVYANESQPNWIESLNKYSINGFLYGNQPMVTLETGVSYQWDLLDVGFDMHDAHWHGNTVLYEGMRTDVIQLLPSQTAEAIMVPDDPGIWLFHCHVDDHLAGGMITRYQVENATGSTAPNQGPAKLPVSGGGGPPNLVANTDRLVALTTVARAAGLPGPIRVGREAR